VTVLVEAAMTGHPATFNELVTDLRAIGVRPGRDLLVHSSLRRVGPVEGGAVTVVEALREVVGPAGALVVPAFTPANSDTSAEHRDRTRGMTSAEYAEFLASMPAFDPGRTPSTGMGTLAETVRTNAAAVRSDHPQTSFAALGGGARQLMAGHAPDCHFGPRSPLFHLYERSADVLLLGVGFNRCTAFHLAEYRYRVPAPTRRYRCRIVKDGRPAWWEYEDVVLDDSDFAQIGAALCSSTDAVTQKPVARATAFRVSLPAAVDFAAAWLAATR
jgi:aminoglycoside 3-N-acetyltransferase